MINFVKEKNPMPAQDPNVRNKNFLEVCTGYTEDMAVREAMRCLKCRKKPCTTGCPVGVKIPDFIAKVAEGDFEAAYQIISETSSLPAICGRVCPQENQCEGKCVRGTCGESVSIGRLERYVADWHRENVEEKPLEVEKNGHKVAVIGAGPAGLACAGDLIQKGYDVTIFESLHKAGGVLAYGIPEFRLPKDIVAKEVAKLENMGVKVVTNAIIGRAITVDELMKEEGFEAVFIGTGAGLPQFMGIPGENLTGVYSANEYLTRITLMKGYKEEYDTPVPRAKNVAIVGGGNVAMDACRCAKRMGAENVYVVYRRSEAELPARAEEYEHATEEGIEFKFLTNPVKVVGEDGKVTGLECVKMELGEPDASGRRRPVAIEGSNFVLDVDCVIMSLGTKLNTLILDTTDKLEANAKGGIGATDDLSATNRAGIFAGGDAVTGAATVIKAMGAGKRGAKGIDEFFNK